VRCGYERREAGDKCVGLEDDSLDPTLPGTLEPEHQLAVAAALQPVLRYRWASQVAAEALEPLAVVRRDVDLRVELESPRASGAQGLLGNRVAAVLGFVLIQDAQKLRRCGLSAGVEEGLVCVLFVVLIHPARHAPTLEDPRQPALDAAHDVNNIVVVRRVLPDEARALAIRARDEDPLRDKRVRVRIEPCAVREALNLEKTAGLGLRESQVVGPRSLPARELVGEDPEDGRGQVGVEGDDPRKLTGQREDPLAIGHVRQDSVHQVNRLLIHAPAGAGRAEPHLA